MQRKNQEEMSKSTISAVAVGVPPTVSDGAWLPQSLDRDAMAVDWHDVLECAGRVQRRRRFGFPARGGVNAKFRRRAGAESKAAWRFASLRTPKGARFQNQHCENDKPKPDL
jgi:hypothetical protein